jgi:hypothetical protein
VRCLFPAVALAGLLVCGPALGEAGEPEPKCGEKIVPDRPGATNGYAAVRSGCLQVETSTQLSPGSSETGQSFPTTLRLGVAGHLEIRLESSLVELAYGQGGGTQVSRGDVALGVKYSLREPEGGVLPALGFMLVGALPGSAQSVSALSPRADLLADWELPAGLALSVNAGVQYAEAFSAERAVHIPLAGVLGFTVPGTQERLGLFVDGAAEYVTAGSDWRRAVGGGLVFLATPFLQIDLSASTDPGGGENPWWMALGISWVAPL